MDDVLQKAQPMNAGSRAELSSDEVVKTYQVITQHEQLAATAAG